MVFNQVVDDLNLAQDQNRINALDARQSVWQTTVASGGMRCQISPPSVSTTG